MAGEFQTHVDEMVREANLQEVRDQFNDLRRMDIKGQILKAVDEDGTIRKTLRENPMDFSPPPPVVPVHDSACPSDRAAERDALPRRPSPTAIARRLTARQSSRLTVGRSAGPVTRSRAAGRRAAVPPPPAFAARRRAGSRRAPPAFVPPSAAAAHTEHA